MLFVEGIEDPVVITSPVITAVIDNLQLLREYK